MTFGVLEAAAAASSAAASSGGNDVTPGVLGFLVVAGIGVALVFLLKSMNKQFRKITPDPGAVPEAPVPETPVPEEPAQQETPK